MCTWSAPRSLNCWASRNGLGRGVLRLEHFLLRPEGVFGLYPRKGAIAVGSDADLVLWDPQERRVVDGAQMRSRAGYSVYDGWAVQGWPRFVIRRGEIVLADGSCTVQPGQGRWVRRDPAGQPSRSG